MGFKHNPENESCSVVYFEFCKAAWPLSGNINFRVFRDSSINHILIKWEINHVHVDYVKTNSN